MLFTGIDFADFEIPIGDTTFSCHKVVLASHSPVFKEEMINKTLQINFTILPKCKVTAVGGFRGFLSFYF